MGEEPDFYIKMQNEDYHERREKTIKNV